MNYIIIKNNLIIKVSISIFLSVFFYLSKNYFLEITKKWKNYSNGKKFIDKCLNNFQINNYNKSYSTPKFSVVIPLYNCEKTIYYPMLSIQKQNMSEYEIILIIFFF